MLGLTYVDTDGGVPENGRGAPFEIDVTGGAADTATEPAPEPLELIVPPLDLMLCQLPLVSP